MRLAVVPLLAVLAAGCGSVQHDRPSMPGSPAGDATRAQWYAALEQTQAADAQPPLSQSDVVRGVRAGAAALGASVVKIHFLPVLGGSAEVVVEPGDPVSFAERPGAKMTTLLGRLDDNTHAYLVTVVDSNSQPLFVLGWVPEAGRRSLGEGIAWHAPGVHSDAVWGDPVTSNSLLQGCGGSEPCAVSGPSAK
ncbi:MAG TPA: hypothetical protein VI142_11220 [Gaiellaceae bacterium]